MKRSIGETARLAGVSVRTLRHYDSIGLLKPSEVSESGYRYYTEDAISALQQILFFRELGFPLQEMKDILSHPDYDRKLALREHRAYLLLKRQHLDALIKLIDETIGGKAMSNENKTPDLEAVKRQYASEVAARWGKTSAYAESLQKHAAYSSDQERAIEHEADALFAAFASLRGRAPSDPAVQDLVRKWQEHITTHHYTCTKEILAGLGQMYACDERFSNYLNRFGDGTAQFISTAISCYCEK